MIDANIHAKKLLELGHKIKQKNLEIKNNLEQFSKKLNYDKKRKIRFIKIIFIELTMIGGIIILLIILIIIMKLKR